MNKRKQKVLACLIICFAMLLVFLCGCSSSNSSSQSNGTPDNNSTTDASSNTTTDTSNNTTTDTSPNSNELSINDIAIVDDFECSIKEINWYSPSDFDFDIFEALEKEEGFEYIVIVLSEKNTTNDTKNAPMLNILSADGKQCNNLSILSLYKKQYKINFGATIANSTAEAYVIYKIPTGSQSFKLQILSNGFGSNSKYFVFERNDIK